MLQLPDNKIASLDLFNVPFVPKTDKSPAPHYRNIYRGFRSHTRLCKNASVRGIEIARFKTGAIFSPQ